MKRKTRIHMDATEYDITSKRCRRNLYRNAGSRYIVKFAKRSMRKKARRIGKKIIAIGALDLYTESNNRQIANER